MKKFVSFMCLVIVLFPYIAAAQATPDAPSVAIDLLPTPEGLVGNWKLVRAPYTLVENEDAWISAATAVYTDDDGNRISIAVRYLQQSLDAASIVSGISDDMVQRYQYLFFNTLVHRNPEVAPCTAVVKVQGEDAWLNPGGFTMCLVNLDVLVWVEVLGEYDGMTGMDASDAIVSLSLANYQ